MSGITLSKKHGVNPSVELCLYCKKPKGLILFGRLKGDEEAPRDVILNDEPCDECKERFAQGVTIFEFNEIEKKPTGNYIVVKDDFIRKIVKNEAIIKSILEERKCVVEKNVFDEMNNMIGEL